MSEYNYKFIVSSKPFDINKVINECNKYPNSKILVEVANTKGITSSMIRKLNPNIDIRIAGGYDKERVKRRKQEYYNSAVIYTRNETIKMLEEIEKIESGLNENWSDIQKLLYIYDRLKSSIMYDPKYETKTSSEIRSLRGLISKKTVCAGYAMILKEFMDRNDIYCEYVEGNINPRPSKNATHAWNIVKIEGKKYPIDLTWDNTTFRSGKSKSFDWLGKDVIEFSKHHYPMPEEKTQDYLHTLSRIDPKIIDYMYYQMGIGRARDYRSTTYYGTRKDGSKYIVAQIGDLEYKNENYYRYYYVEISKDVTKRLPLILYGNTNITDFVNKKNFGKPIEKNYEECIDNILFSKENIADSLAKKTYYIGGVEKSTNKNKTELVSSYKEITKTESKNNLFTYNTKRYLRSDGSVFIAQQMPFNKNGMNVFKYDIFEMVNENGKSILKRNVIYTEKDFFQDTRKGIPNDFLSRERLDRKSKETGGYLGYYDLSGIRTNSQKLIDYFETSKKININYQNQQVYNSSIKIPTFNELKEFALKYELDVSSPKIIVKDKSTGKIQTDKGIVAKAIFANIWLSAAGVKYYRSEPVFGMTYAFNESAQKLYYTICRNLLDSCKRNGYIDTLDLFKNINNFDNYKHNMSIIVNLFRSPYQTEFINKLFLQSIGINKSKEEPQALYNLSYAGELSYNSPNSRIV